MSPTSQSTAVQSSAHRDGPQQQSRLPRPICWHEGMLLSPQHFQQNHQYWESQLCKFIGCIAPSFWGVGELKLDRSSLLEGYINITRLMAIMPDGLLIDYDAKVDEPLTLSLESDESVTIQLAVPIQVPGSASERTEIQRYTSQEDQPKLDENTGDNELVMPRLHARLSLQAAQRVGNRFVGLPLFRVIKPDDGNFQLDPNYTPPLLNIAADVFRSGDDKMMGSKPLQLQAQNLALSIRQKARQLAGLSEDGENLGSNINQTHHRWVRAMVQELLAFEQLADSPCSTPAALYQGLINMVGPISELDPTNIPPRFDIYNHDDALPGIARLMKYIKHQINRVNLSYTMLGFELIKDGSFVLNFDQAWAGRDLLIEVKPTSSGSAQKVTSWLATCRIASANVHKALQQRRMLGVKAEFIERDEKSGITAAPGSALFRIESNKKYIRPGVKLTIKSSSGKYKDDAPAAIILYLPHEQ